MRGVLRYRASAAGKAPSSQKNSANFDADGDGSLNETELQSLMDDIGSRTGQSGGSSAKDLLSSSDSNADGSLSTDELEAALPSMLPPRSTMDFAQSRGAGRAMTCSARWTATAAAM
jgi:Ca2+-binding EF-hand superfamily protein